MLFSFEAYDLTYDIHPSTLQLCLWFDRYDPGPEVDCLPTGDCGDSDGIQYTSIYR